MQVLAYAAILIVFLGLLRSADENRRSSQTFAKALAGYLATANVPLAVHALPEDVAFYLPLHLTDAGDLPYALLVVDHSPKDPPETPETLTAHYGEGRVIDADHIDLPGVPSTGRWRLYQVRIDRSGPKT
jgi:hypothetical protein